ncbi:MAG: hypothetical protein ACFE0O_01305 [Opitutales bacterium]
MGSPDRHNQSSVSLDDLLRLKRHEKPAPEFWDRFEQDLQRKTLKAAMEQQSLRHTLGRGLLLAMKPLLGTGAAALVAFGLYLQLDLRSLSDGSAPVPAEQTFAAQVNPPAAQPTEADHSVSAEPAAPRPSILVKSDNLMINRSASRTSFEADVISPRGGKNGRSSYARDMQPTVFQVKSEQSVIYLADEVLSKAAVRMPTTAHLGL